MLFAQIRKDSEGDDLYSIEIGEFVDKATKQVEDFHKRLAKLKEVHVEACTFFLFAKSDDKVEKSEEFFKFFTDYFEQIYKSLPKEEKKKKAPARAGAKAAEKKIGGKVETMPGVAKMGGKVGDSNPSGAMGNLIAELKKKQGT